MFVIFNKKISIKYLIITSFSTIILILSCLLLNTTFSYFKDFTYNEAIINASNNLDNIANILDIKLSYITDFSSNIIHNHQIKKILTTESNSLVSQIENSKLTNELLVNYSFLNEYINSINIYSKNYFTMDSYYSYYSDVLINYSSKHGLKSYDVYEKILSDTNSNLYHYLDNIYINHIPDSSIFMIFEQIKNSNNETDAVLSITLDKDYLFGNFSDLISTLQSDLFLIDLDGKPLYHPLSDSEHICVNEEPNLINLISGDSGWTYLSSSGEKNILCYNKLDDLDWYIVSIIPYSLLLKEFNQTKHLLLLISFIMIFIAIVVGIIMSNLITNPISKLISTFTEIEEGHLSIQAKPSPLLEVNTLNTSFNSMLQKINSLLHEIDHSHCIQRESELKALQAQINPHFLYNTLDAIYWMSDNEDVADIIQNLAQLFRLSLNKGQDEIKVAQELQQVHSYIAINLIRFKDKFTYIEEIDPAVLDGMTIKLILQPLVENCILHGLKFTKTGGIIKLSAYLKEASIIFSVEDNGTGVDENLMKNIMNTNMPNKSYGLKNIQERLWIRYGKSYCLDFKNKIEGGCIATITIPYQEKGER